MKINIISLKSNTHILLFIHQDQGHYNQIKEGSSYHKGPNSCQVKEQKKLFNSIKYFTYFYCYYLLLIIKQ